MIFLALARTAAAADSLGGYLFAYGEPHAHTGISHDGWSSDLGDGCAGEGDCGAFADVYDTARASGLDWVVLSDHVNGADLYSATDAEFLTLMDMAIDHGADTDLVVIPGAEVWFAMGGAPLGHKNLLFFGDPDGLHDLAITDVRPTETEEGEITACSDITDWMDDLTSRFGDALLIGHHPMVVTPMPTDWSCTGGAYEPAVEMFSAWGTGLGWSFDFELPESIAASGAVSVAMNPDGFALNLGFLGGTDSHNTLPGDLCQVIGGGRVSTGGLTLAVIPESDGLSRTALHDAIVDHRTLATSGPRFPILPSYTDTRGTTWSLGETIELPMGESLTLHVDTATEGADAVDSAWFVYPDGETPLRSTGTTSWDATIDAADVPDWLYVAFKLDGAALGLCDDSDSSDAEWVWASPSWIVPTDHDWDADGVSYADGDVDDDDPSWGACTDTSTIDVTTATLGDGDGDGIADAVELDAGIDPCRIDTDADGLLDADELHSITDPADADSDDDGLGDGDELLTWLTNPVDADTDDDGLLDGDEVALGTSALLPDTDGDTLDDGAEVEAGTSPLLVDTDGDTLDDAAELMVLHTDPTLADTDGDGLDDAEEFVLGTDPTDGDSDDDDLADGDEAGWGADPLNPDSDGDGVEDGGEVTVGSSPTDADTDDDGLDDLGELHAHTDATNPDTDGDTLSDGDEVDRGTDPLAPDSDTDGLSDGDEVARGTDPLLPDTDQDGLGDGDEVALGTDPTDTDTDDDTLPDGDEVDGGTSPTNPDTDGDGLDDATDPDPLHVPVVDTGETGATDDTGAAEDTGEKPGSRTCGCAAAGSPSAAVIVLGAALLRRRRR